MANLFIKMLEKFCQGTVFVQEKQRGRQSKNKNQKRSSKKQQKEAGNEEMSEIDKVRLPFSQFFSISFLCVCQYQLRARARAVGECIYNEMCS